MKRNQRRKVLDQQAQAPSAISCLHSHLACQAALLPAHPPPRLARPCFALLPHSMCPLSIMVCHVKPVSSRLARLMMSPFFTCAHERKRAGQASGEQ